MREVGATPRDQPPARVADRDAALDEISAELGEVLGHADALLAEWARFASASRQEVERQVEGIAAGVATAIDAAVDRAVDRTAAVTDAAVGRAFEQRIGAQLGSLSSEIARLEHRARAAARGFAEERTGDRRLTWAVVAGVALANVLIAILLLRGPSVPAGQPADPRAPTSPAGDPTRASSLAPGPERDQPAPAAASAVASPPASTGGAGAAGAAGAGGAGVSRAAGAAGAGAGGVGSGPPSAAAEVVAGSPASASAGAPGSPLPGGCQSGSGAKCGDGAAPPAKPVRAGTVPRYQRRQ